MSLNTLYEPIKPIQYILSGRKDELTKAYIRSAYWARMARLETAKHLNFLYRWIAAEAMAKLDRLDDIVPRACLCIGFPLNVYSLAMDPAITRRLKAIPDYATWRHFFQNHLETARDRRNAIVHNGFRTVEISDEELRTFQRILTFVLSRMSGYLQAGILGGLTTLSEFWEMMPLLLSENANLLNEVEGTIIFTFKTGMFADSGAI